MEEQNGSATAASPVMVLAMGNNRDGQLGTGILEDEDTVFQPTQVEVLANCNIISCGASLKHSVWLTQDGVIYTAGDNDDGQLGRAGKRSKPFKVDAIEHLPIETVQAGDGFTVLAAKLDGRLLGVGRGDRGQLGMGGADRENKERVKFSAALGDEQLLTLAAGESHCIGLCRSGRVLTFGENKHGQLGLGDFVSSATPRPVASLQCRPIVRVCCGAAHSLAQTATGLLWSWGCNDHGQLGLGDLKPRLRPEQVKALRVSRCVDVSAGNRHTLALSEKGLAFSFGAGGSGQLGGGGVAEAEPQPRVIDALREAGRCLLLRCGHSHCVALVWNEDAEREALYVWGLGSSGQLGLPKSALQDGKFVALPQRLKLQQPNLSVLDICSGPLAHHTFLLVSEGGTSSSGGSPFRGASGGSSSSPSSLSLRHSLRTAIDADDLSQMLRRAAASGADATSSQMKALIKAVGASFSSVSVLNASFQSSRSSLALTEEASGVDMLKVRRAYRTLVFELKSPELISTLGRATLSICDELQKQKVPADDPENLSVFLVLFENPLLLAEHRTALFPGFHNALQRLTAAVLSLPKESRALLFGWLRRLPSEYFGRVVEVMQQYVTFSLTQPGQKSSDASAAVLMLENLWDINRQMGGILPEWCFHNPAVSQSEELPEHYQQWQQQQSMVFSYCKYPFLLNAEAKRRLLSFDAEVQMKAGMQKLVHETWQGLPMQCTFEQLVQFKVRREHLLADFCGQLWWRLQHKPVCLQLPLNVEFQGELGVDAGGLRKECLQLVLRQLHEQTTLFYELEELPGLLWFTPSTPSGRADYWRKGKAPMDCSTAGSGSGDVDSENQGQADGSLMLHDADWANHLPEVAGAIVGLAGFNGIYLDLRVHPLVYRLLVQPDKATNFEDLAAVHPTLHRSLGILQQHHDSVASLGLSWVVRVPGLDEDIDLRTLSGAAAAAPADEAAVGLQPADVEQFVHVYTDAALVGLARPQVQSFVQMARACMGFGLALSLCSAHDLELLLCGSADLGDFRELELSCQYGNGYTAESEPVRFFWQVVHGMSEAWKRKLLLFCTGCDRVPIVGLKALKFIIARSTAELDHLPTSNTCINQLNLPEYTELQVTHDRLYAALEHNIGFGFA